MPDASAEFAHFIARAGLQPPAEVHGDGKLHRFSSTGRRGDDSGWYVLHMDGDVPAGAFGDWRTGLQANWCSKPEHTLSQAQRDAYRQRIAQAKAQREAEEAQRQALARQRAVELMRASRPVSSHPYLVAKGIQATRGIRSDGDKLLIPLRDTAGTLHSVQLIDAQGRKRFLPGGRIKGCYLGIGQPQGMLIVCEGYATGASLFEATGEAVAVAFNAGNLLAVAESLRARFPKLRLVIAADDDHLTEGNPGQTKAREAAEAVSGWLAIPLFPSQRTEKDTDFNDMHRLAGLQAVRDCVAKAVHIVQERPAETPDALTPRTEVVLTNGADLRPEPVKWLWPSWLALGKLHILAGAPGQGKTTIALACAATVTGGGRWPDGGPCEPGNVLIWSAEDDPADTLLPRLLASGADRSRCYFVSGTRIDGEVQPFDPARDMRALKTRAQVIGNIRLLIVDPVVSAVSGDSHKNTEVRRALQPLVDLAAALDVAVLGISHFSKGGAGGDPATRVVGSVAFSAVARVVLVAAKVKGQDGDTERRILARGKSNIGPDGGGYEYRIEQGEPLPGISASYVTWGNRVEGSARDLLAEPDAVGSSEEPATAQTEAEEFLITLLREGPSPTKYVEEQAREAGISWRTVRRASDALGIRKRKLNGAWYWERPNLANQLVQLVQTSDVGQVGQLDGQVASDTHRLWPGG